MKYNIFFSYAHKDNGHIKRLIETLEDYCIEASTLDDILNVGDDFKKRIIRQIADAKVIVVFLTENSIRSSYCNDELEYILEISESRDKLILFLAQWGKMTLDLLPENMRIKLKNKQLICLEDGLHSCADYKIVAGKIYDYISFTESKQLLYNQLAIFRKNEYDEKSAEKLSEIILLLYNQLASQKELRNIYSEICKCAIELNNKTGLGYDHESRITAKSIINNISCLRKLNGYYRETDDLFLLSVYIITIACGIEIEADCIDTITNGDVHCPQDTFAVELATQHQKYCEQYRDLIGKQVITADNCANYSQPQAEIILLAKNYLALRVSPIPLPPSSDRTPQFAPEHKETQVKLSEEEQKLWEIADYIEKSNHIFELIGNEKSKAQYLRCLKASYERLQKFCEVSGCKHVGAACIERVEAIKLQLEKFDVDDENESMAQKAIRAILGLTIIGNGTYDVFISYKHEDKDIAANVYNYLISNLVFPFVDYISLPEIAKSEYEGAIMNALENSNHFIVIISDLAYFDSQWIDLEMRTFRHEIIEGRKNNANFVILVTDDVFQEIIKTNKTCIDIKYRMYEIIPISKYKDSIIKYLKTE